MKCLCKLLISSWAGCAIMLAAPISLAQSPASGKTISERVIQSPAPGKTISERVIQSQNRQPRVNVVARVSVRITQLENELRRLTGQNEELMHRLRLLEDELRKAQTNANLRLKALEGSKSLTSPNALATNVTADARGVPRVTLPSGTPVVGADKGAKLLGTVRSSTSTDGSQRLVARKETPEEQYERAQTLILKHQKFGDAEQVLRQFIINNPKHSKVAAAHYWLGRTFFVRSNFENAAFAFAEGFQKFPNSNKAPANLLNLGMSLSRLGKNREACTTYSRLLRTYRKTPDLIKRRITRERRRAKCRRR